MKKPVFITIAAILVVIAGITGYQLMQQSQSNPAAAPVVVENPKAVSRKPLIGEIRPEFVLPDVNGVARNVREWDGKILVINFWATWCGPCLTEIPAFIKLQEKYGNQGLQFVGLAVHTTDEIREYISEAGLNYPSLVGKEEVSKVARAFGNRFGVMPYTVVINRDRRIYFIRSGPLKYEEAEAIINSII